ETLARLSGPSVDTAYTCKPRSANRGTSFSSISLSSAMQGLHQVAQKGIKIKSPSASAPTVTSEPSTVGRVMPRVMALSPARAVSGDLLAALSLSQAVKASGALNIRVHRVRFKKFIGPLGRN